MLNIDKKTEIIFHFNKMSLQDTTIPMWVIKAKGETYYVNHVDMDAGVGFSTKETPDNPSTFDKNVIFINKDTMSKKLTKEEFIEQAKKIHGDNYDYNLVDYINTDTNVRILCKLHGEFSQTPYTHKSGGGCSKCRSEKLSLKYRDSLEDFINKAIKIHFNTYDYSSVKYVNQIVKINITCRKHGDFKQTPHSHLSGKGCPICKESKGEREIREYLVSNNILFIPQYKFDECKNPNSKRKLPFDFYLPSYKTCIEYNGRQHYSYKNGGFGASLEQTKINYLKLTKNDNIKKQYCLDNQIGLLVIKYDENIKDLLKSELNNNK